MNKYKSPLRTKKQANTLEARLRLIGTQQSIDAAKLLQKSWQSVAARPLLAQRMIELSKQLPRGRFLGH